MKCMDQVVSNMGPMGGILVSSQAGAGNSEAPMGISGNEIMSLGKFLILI